MSANPTQADGMKWHPADTAPKDGTHFLAADFTEGAVGFGYFKGHTMAQPRMTVVHYYDGVPEDAGFYTSVNELEPKRTFYFTDWMPLPRAMKGATKTEVRQLYDAMRLADATMMVLRGGDTSSATADEQFEAAVTLDRSRAAYARARLAYENAVRDFAEAELSGGGGHSAALVKAGAA